MLRSLRVRTALALIVLIVAAFAALGSYVFLRVEDRFRQSAESDLASQAQVVRNVAEPLFAQGAEPGAFDSLAKQLGAQTGTRVTLIAVDGTVLGDSEADPATMDNHLSRAEVQQAVRSGVGSARRHSVTSGSDLKYVALAVTDRDALTGIVRVARPTAALDAPLSDIRRSLLIATIITAAAAGVLGLLIINSILRPLRRLSHAARALASGDLGQRVTPRPPGEIGELADAFNEMAQNLEGQAATTSRERNRLMAVLNSSTDAVMAVDSGGSIRFANVAAERLLKRAQQELIGVRLSWVMPEEQVMAAVRASGEAERRQSLLIERPRHQYLQVVTTPIVAGGESDVLVICHDVSDMKRVEETRRDFVANISHELRTPLASIRSVVETLQSGALEDRAAASKFLSLASEEVDRLARLVQELLELFRIESGELTLKREPVDMTALLAATVERLQPYAEKQGLSLRLNSAREPLIAQGDRSWLERAVVNLVQNAIQFTPAGGSIEVSASAAGDAIMVNVADTGIGIPPEELPRVFERFYKIDRARTGGGSGLGLALVKHAIEAHGGSVHVESELGRGSTFSFTIPVEPPTSAG